MKFAVQVTGHELIRATKLGGEDTVKIKLRGQADPKLKVEFIVAEDERVQYPFGCSATLDFDVQQTIPLER